MKKSVKRLLAALLAFSCSFGICACQDLGDFENDAAFYAAVGDVAFVCPASAAQAQTIRKYDIEDITNNETQQATKKDDPDTEEDETATPMPEDRYKYVVFEILEDTVDVDGEEKDAVIDDMCLWILPNAEFSGLIQAEVYLSDSEPVGFFKDDTRSPYAGKYEYRKTATSQSPDDKICFDGYGKAYDNGGHSATYVKTTLNGVTTLRFTLSYTEDSKSYNVDYVCTLEEPYETVSVTKKVNGGTETKRDFSYAGEYGETSEAGLKSSKKVADATAGASGGEWTSFFIEDWTVDGKPSSTIKISEGTYVYIKILNNCFGASRMKLSPVAFRANNLMLRAVAAGN